MARGEKWLMVAMDRYTMRVRGRDACMDDVKTTTLKEK